MPKVWTLCMTTLLPGLNRVLRRPFVTVAILVPLVSLDASQTQAATINVAAPSGPAQVASAFAAASNGDTVMLPSNGGPFTWTSPVTLSGSKCLTLNLNGNEIILSGASGRITVNSHASCLNRVTNGTVTKSGTGYADYRGPFEIRDSLGEYAVRVDHITFRSTDVSLADGTIISMNGEGAGLLDHCDFVDIEPVHEFIHIDAWGAASDAGWDSDVDKGGAGLFYFEDNTFTNAEKDGGGNNAWIQGYYGARVVVRFNTFNFVAFDSHGTAGNIGMRWWEVYNNDFNHIHSNDNNTYQLNFRAGSGIVFNNTGSSGTRPTKTGMCEEDGDYPAPYQIGRGTNQTLDPAYYFGNTTLSLSVNGCDAPEEADMVALNRDVYSSTNASCTAGGSCTTGVGIGTTLPTSCTTGVGFWKTDAGGNWNTTGGGANDGALYTCRSTNNWTRSYTPLTYPHPLVTGSPSPPAAPAAPTNLRILSH